MYLQGQATRRASAANDAGFALAALLVAIAILSVMMLVALPTWSHQAQREKEMELIFRGEQYARAINLYQRKLAGALPPSLDVLVDQKFLRKRYKDPITGEDFVPVYASAQISAPSVTRETSIGPDGRPRVTVRFQGRGAFNSPEQFAQGVRQSVDALRTAGTGTGIVGVVSKSKAPSIRLYNGRDHYDQWVFIYMGASTGGPGAMPMQQQMPGGRGLRGEPTPGGRGASPGRGRGRGF